MSQPLIDLQNLTFAYPGAPRPVLNNFSFQLRPGQRLGLIGPNGCGKTTVLDLLCNHRKPASGKIKYQGKDLHRFSSKALAREIALVPQNFYINFPFRFDLRDKNIEGIYVKTNRIDSSLLSTYKYGS